MSNNAKDYVWGNTVFIDRVGKKAPRMERFAYLTEAAARADHARIKAMPGVVFIELKHTVEVIDCQGRK